MHHWTRAAPEHRSAALESLRHEFQGAFSDNVLANLVIFMMIGLGLHWKTSHRRTGRRAVSLPFILFSMAGGFLADRFSNGPSPSAEDLEVSSDADRAG
jgi:hypothetical protein